MAVEVKICGLTTLADARMALEQGADYLGFVLHADSPRGITPAQLRQIRDALDATVACVAVVVNRSRAEVESIASDNALAAVQLCGEEDAGVFAGMPVPVWRVLRRAPAGWRPAEPEAWAAVRYVVDANVPGFYGGTGKTADWAAAAVLATKVKVMLSGGLTVQNVGDGMRRVRPVGVDVASGVEASPGRKDPLRMKQFIAAVRAAESTGTEAGAH